jgi:NAD(P)-dependent dehydrogenase (short-subunit alcohol dehydrogenase family)
MPAGWTPARAAAPMSLRDQVAIVTGGASGIGRAIAQSLLEVGAVTYVLDRSLSGIPSGVTGLVADVSDFEAMTAAFNQVLTVSGRIDVLFNNAGVVSHTDVIAATVDEFDRVMAVNARGVFIGMKLALPPMVAARRGAIVNTASAAALIGLPGRATYSASKGAVVALSRQAAVEYAPHGVRVNCICPGTTNSPITQDMMSRGTDGDDIRRELENRQPLRRMADPQEVAAAALFLASDQASFVTGVCLQVDGGWTSA